MKEEDRLSQALTFAAPEVIAAWEKRNTAMLANHGGSLAEAHRRYLAAKARTDRHDRLIYLVMISWCALATAVAYLASSSPRLLALRPALMFVGTLAGFFCGSFWFLYVDKKHATAVQTASFPLGAFLSDLRNASNDEITAATHVTADDMIESFIQRARTILILRNEFKDMRSDKSIPIAQIVETGQELLNATNKFESKWSAAVTHFASLFENTSKQRVFNVALTRMT